MAIKLKDIDFEKSELPEIAKAVVQEVNRIDDNFREKLDILNSNYEELKSIVDERDSGVDDTLLDERIKKFAEDISIRQVDVDKMTAQTKSFEDKVSQFENKMVEFDEKLTKRWDELEVALQRPGVGSGSDKDKEFEEAKQFFIDNLVIRNKSGNPISDEMIEGLNIDLDAFKTYKKVFKKYLKRGDEKVQQVFPTAEEQKALSVASDPDGGYTVSPFMSNQIITRLFESDPVRQLASSITISTGAYETLVDWDEAGAEWESETVSTTNYDTPQWNKVRIPVHNLATRPRATQTLLDDSGINIESWLANKVSDKFARTEGAAFITGDGVNRPRGVLTYANGTNYGQIEQTNLGLAAAISADGLIDVKYSMIEQYLNRGSWLVNRLTVSELMQLKDGMGNYLWKPAQIAGDPTSTLLALPVRMSTTMPTVAANALAFVLADWREAYLIIDRMGITVQRDPYTQKPYIEFYTRKRVGADVVNFQAIKIGKIAV